MFKNPIPAKGTFQVASVLWQSQNAAPTPLGNLSHEHISNIYWMQRIAHAVKYLERKFPTMNELNFAVELKKYITTKFGYVAQYLPRMADEAATLHALGFLGTGNAIVLNGELIGNLNMVGVSVGQAFTAPVPLTGNKTPKELPIGLTTDYNRFTLHPGNRKVNPLTVGQIMTSLGKYNNLSDTPIVVNDDDQIVDKQHLFLAAKQLGLAFRVVRAKPLEITGGTSTNSATTNFLGKAGVTNLPGLRSPAAVVNEPEKIIRSNKTFPMLSRAEQQKNADDILNLSTDTQAARNNLLAGAGIKPGGVEAVAKQALASTSDGAVLMATANELQGKATMTWAALRLHLNIGDNPSVNREAVAIIHNGLIDAWALNRK